MRLDEEFPKKEILRRAIRKTLMTAERRGMVAQTAIPCPDHLAVGRADRHELVQCIHNRRAGKNVAHLPNHLDAQVQSVSEVDHIRPETLQELPKIQRDGGCV